VSRCVCGAQRWTYTSVKNTTQACTGNNSLGTPSAASGGTNSSGVGNLDARGAWQWGRRKARSTRENGPKLNRETITITLGACPCVATGIQLSKRQHTKHIIKNSQLKSSHPKNDLKMSRALLRAVQSWCITINILMMWYISLNKVKWSNPILIWVTSWVLQ
jgi:hypothetical protein